MNKQNDNQVKNECVGEAAPVEVCRFDPVISKITKPLKPQGIHAGVTVSVKGNF
jgi:hypothetical protein